MGTLGRSFALCVFLMLAAQAHAQPVPGTYSTPDLGGTMLPGRATRSWQAPEPEIWHAESWDGATLGTQWQFRCAASTSVTVIEDSRDGQGTGTVIFELTLTGGTFFLSGTGPWSGGSGSITGTLLTTTIVQTQEWQFWSRLSAYDDIVAQGSIDGTVCSIVLHVDNAVQASAETPIPNYPELLHSDCLNVRSFGQSMDFPGEITLSIDCTVNVDSQAWAVIKNLYR